MINHAWVNNSVITSDFFAVFVEVSLEGFNSIASLPNLGKLCFTSIILSRLWEKQLYKHNVASSFLLSNVCIDHSLILCDDVMCQIIAIDRESQGCIMTLLMHWLKQAWVVVKESKDVINRSLIGVIYAQNIAYRLETYFFYGGSMADLDLILSTS